MRIKHRAEASAGIFLQYWNVLPAGKGISGVIPSNFMKTAYSEKGTKKSTGVKRFKRKKVKIFKYSF